MSIFDDNNEDVKEAIQFFNQLSDKDKITIISDLKPQTLQQTQYYDKLLPLLSKIQKDISKFDDIRIGNKLMELGLDETYARLFVSNVKKQAPTKEYQLSQLARIPEDVFCKNMPHIMKSLWVDNIPDTEIQEKYSVTHEQLSCITNITNNMLQGLARGELTAERIKKENTDQISDKKLDVLLNEVLVYQKHWRDAILFSNIQDASSNTRRIVRQNNNILKIMGEMFDILLDLRDERRRM